MRHENQKIVDDESILISKFLIGRKRQSFVHLKSIEK